MQPSVLSPTIRKLSLQAARPAFSVVAVYDGFFANIRAMEALDWLKRTLCPVMQVCPLSWSFDKLEEPKERSTAVRAAAAADLLIVSAADDTTLPEHIRQWFDGIPTQQRDARPVIVALHDEGSEFNNTRNSICAHLKEVAGAWETEFMCNADFDQRLDHEFATQLLSGKGPTSRHRAKPFGGEFAAAPRYWGING